MTAGRIDVLAVMAASHKVAEDYVRDANAECDCIAALVAEQVIEASAAVAKLIEAAKKAQAMMAMPERIEPRHRQELCDAIAHCEIVADPRLARVHGGAL